MVARLLALVALLAAAVAPATAAPARVVSINLCTDQLAMLLAAPGQLRSVSFLARDPTESVMVEEASRYPINHGGAEEVFLLHPDLVLAGSYTTPATVDMLHRLGFAVAVFEPDYSFDDIRASIRRMGGLLGRQGQAEAMVASLDARLAALEAEARDTAALGPPPLGAMYYANGRTSGLHTLMNRIMQAAGWRNLAAELGIEGVGELPLELLVMNRPDAVIGSERDDSGPALATENYRNPALLASIRSGVGIASLASPYQLCGGPFTTEAVRLMLDERKKLAAARAQRPAKGTP